MKDVAAGRSLARDTGLITVLTLFSRFTGLARIAVVSAVLGATLLGDVYQGANMVPTLLFELIAGGAIQAVLVPLFVREADNGPERSHRAFGVVLGTFVAYAAVASALLAVLSPVISRLIAADSGASFDDRVRVGTLFLAVFAPQMIFYAIGAVSAAQLQAQRKFIAGAIAPAINNVVVIIVYLLFYWVAGDTPVLTQPMWHLLLLAGGTTLAVVAFTSVPLVFLLRDQPIRVRYDRGDEVVREVRSIGGWAFLQIVGTLAPTIAALVVGAREEGAVAVFSYAYAVFLLPFSLFAAPVATAMLPRLALFNERRDTESAASVFRGAYRPALVALTFAAISLLAVGESLARILSFGLIAENGLSDYSTSIQWLGVGVVGYGIWFICVRSMMAFGEVRKSALVTVLGAVTGITSMPIGLLLFPDTAVAVVLAASISIGFSLCGVVATVLRPVATRSGNLFGSGSSILAIGTGLFAYLAMSIGLQNFIAPSNRLEAIAVLLVVALVAVPIAVAIGLMCWHPRLAPTRSNDTTMLIGPSDGGIRRHVVSLAEELMKRGSPVTVVAPAGVVEFIERESPMLQTSIVEVPAGFNPVSWLRAVRQLRGVNVSDGTLHCHGLKPAMLALLAGHNPILTWHNKVNRVSHGGSALVLMPLEKFVSRRCRAVICTTTAMVSQLRRWGVSDDRITLCEPVHRVPMPRRDVVEIRSQLRNGTQLLIVCVARMHRQKGVDTLLQSVVARADELRAFHAQVVIVGDGPLRNELEMISSSVRDLVTFVGADDDAISYIRAADLLVIPSRWESGPLVALEGREFGIPIVATRTGFMAQWEDLPAVRLVDPEDHENLGKLIIESLSSHATPQRFTSGASVLERSVDTVSGVYRSSSKRNRDRGSSARPFLLLAFLALFVMGLVTSRPNATALPVVEGPVLIVSVPGLEWEDVRNFNMDTIGGLPLRASLSVRTIGARTSLQEAYISLGSGNRATMRSADAPFLLPPFGGCSQQLHDAAQEDADRKLYEADPGVLGEALASVGAQRIVFGSTMALAALMDNNGCVDAFNLGVPDSAFAADLGVKSVALVELPQIYSLWVAANPDTASSVPLRPSESALSAAAREVDTWISEALNALPETGALYVVSPVSHPGRTNLTVVAARIGASSGTMLSGTTRREGFVTLTDVAPTLVNSFGLSIPNAMNGTEFTRSGREAKSINGLVNDSERTTARNLAVGPVSVVFVVAQIILYLIAAALILGRRRINSTPMRVGIIAIPVVPVAVFGLSALPLYRLNSTFATLTIYACVGLLSFLIAKLVRGPVALAVTLVVGANWLLQVVDIVLGGRLQINTVFGYSATVAGRFQGFGNLAFAVAAVSGLVVAAVPVLMQKPIFGFSVRGWVLFVGFITLIADGFPWFGADVGGVLAIVPAFGCLWLMANGEPINFRRLFGVGVAGVVALSGLALFDLSRPKESQTHLGRFVRKLFDGEAGTIIERKVSANIHMLTSSVWTWLVPIVAVFFIVLMFRSKGALMRVRSEIPGLDALIVSATVLGVLGFAVNDSGVVIPSMMFGVMVPLTLSALVYVENKGAK
jgi:peptidoglycan biosynthesis protein MviN/MurJ (putative lipid II flippase)/glycosyltransferase involved in cell wall biosynthesis